MAPEIKYLAMISTFTALLWMPYVLNIPGAELFASPGRF